MRRLTLTALAVAALTGCATQTATQTHDAKPSKDSGDAATARFMHAAQQIVPALASDTDPRDYAFLMDGICDRIGKGPMGWDYPTTAAFVADSTGLDANGRQVDRLITRGYLIGCPEVAR